MTHPGLTIMINRPFGTNKPSKAIPKSKDKIISDVDLTEERLLLSFVDGHGLEIRDAGQSCCEHRYLHTDDDLGGFVGARFVDAEIRDAPDVENEWGVHEVQFLIVKTNLGSFTVETHNEHNGYYGGFWIVAEEVQT